MSGPRNRPAFEAGQRKREAIRAILAGHDPLALPLTAEELRLRLEGDGIYISTSAVYWHLQSLRGSRRHRSKGYNGSSLLANSDV